MHQFSLSKIASCEEMFVQPTSFQILSTLAGCVTVESAMFFHGIASSVISHAEANVSCIRCSNHPCLRHCSQTWQRSQTRQLSRQLHAASFSGAPLDGSDQSQAEQEKPVPEPQHLPHATFRFRDRSQPKRDVSGRWWCWAWDSSAWWAAFFFLIGQSLVGPDWQTAHAEGIMDHFSTDALHACCAFAAADLMDQSTILKRIPDLICNAHTVPSVLRVILKVQCLNFGFHRTS